MKPEKNNYNTRSLLQQLIRARLVWMGNVKIPGLETAKDDTVLTATHRDISYTIVKNANGITLYRATKTATPQPIAQSVPSEPSAELKGLFTIASKTYDSWLTAIYHDSVRQDFGNVVTVRELFNAIDDPKRLTYDAADEIAYQALVTGINTEADLLSCRKHAYETARSVITAICISRATSSRLLTVDDSNPSPISWRVKIDDTYASSLTDLHVRVCPDYHAEGVEGDRNRETAVQVAALIILLSVMEQNNY